MMLTLSQPAHTELHNRNTHDFAPKYPQFRARVSPQVKSERPVTTSSMSHRPRSVEAEMATQHRGLPPPSSILQEPPRMSNAMSSAPAVQPSGHMPAPPMQWHGQEDSMRNWLAAKAEEDKRKQEEERTRQETLKLEQRRIEQSMLRESLSGGVPPHMIPMIYAGIGGAGFAQLSMDWLHQYAAQMQAAQQQQVQPASPMRAQRMLGQTSYQAPPAAGQQTAGHYAVEAAPQQQGTASSFVAYPTSSRNAPTSAPRSIAQAQLPRLTTNDNYIHQPSSNNPGSAHPLQQSQTLAHDAPASSPNIYFHHWVPPAADSKNPQTPATKTRRDDEPLSAVPGSHFSDGEYKDSPRKRKAQGGHQANPPPATAAPYGSPSFSTTSSVSSKRVGHQRNRSTASFKDDQRPDSRREERHRMSFQQAVSMREQEEQAEQRPLSRETETAAGADRRRVEELTHIPESHTTRLDRPPS